MNDLTDLYQERAKWADLEGDISRDKQLAVVGGFWWRLFSWLERKAAQGRAMVQSEIDEVTIPLEEASDE